MRVTGAATLAGSAGTVMAALGDPDLLVRAIPGCERLDPTGVGRCLLTVTTAIAAVSGTYTAEAAIVERRWPGRAHSPADGPAGGSGGGLADGPGGGLAGGSADGPGGGLADGLVVATISAAGNRGTARAEITMRLTPAGEVATRVSYDIDAAVAGAIAGIGQRMLASIATRLAAEFLAALGGLLSEPGPAAEPRAAALADAPAAEPPRVAEPVVVEPRLVESIVAGPTVVRRPADGAADRDQPRVGTGPAVRAGVVAGGAVGLAGIVIGALLGRRNRAAGRDSR